MHGGAGHQIIAFTGLAGSGKSTAAKHLCTRHGFERVRFAGPLKDMMRALGLTEREIEGDRKESPCALLTRAKFPDLLKNVTAAFVSVGVATGDPSREISRLCGRTYGYARDTFVEVLSWVVALGGDQGATPRLLMQMIGTEWGRTRIGSDVWVLLWKAAVDRLDPTVPVVVDDCRFPNEAAAVRAAGGTLVAVERPGAGTASTHVSEGQDLGPVVRTIRNTGTVAAFLTTLDREMRDLSWVGHTH
jgi:hypothetical protein